MKKLLVLTACSFILFSCKSTPKDAEENNKPASSETRKAANETEENIYKAADSMMTAFKNRDWNTFVRFNNPAMVKMMGGPEQFEKVVTDQMKYIPDTAIIRMEAGKILQVVKTDDDQQCIVEQEMQMNMSGYKITSTNYLIGESRNGGKNWTFFDASNGGAVKPSTIKPNLSQSLIIPEKKQDAQKL